MRRLLGLNQNNSTNNSTNNSKDLKKSKQQQSPILTNKAKSNLTTNSINTKISITTTKSRTYESVNKIQGLGLNLPIEEFNNNKNNNNNTVKIENNENNDTRMSKHVKFNSEFNNLNDNQLNQPINLNNFSSNSNNSINNNNNNNLVFDNGISVDSIGLGHPSSYSSNLKSWRSTSPLSLSPNLGEGSRIHSSLSSNKGKGKSPYLFSESYASLARESSERDNGLIHAPLLWSQIAQNELVQNVSGRERTRQEILYEVVASEERYVLELQSLMTLYVQPLLHPLLSPPSSPSPSSPRSTFHNTSPQSIKPVTSRSPLPIAGKFLRAVEQSNNYYDSTRSRNSIIKDSREMPEILGTDRSDSVLSSARNDHFGPTNGSYRSEYSPPSSPTSPHQNQNQNRSGRISSMSSNFRHPLRPTVDSNHNKLHKPKSQVPKEVFTPAVLPENLRKVLESIELMIDGHRSLSSLLREEYIRAFPLVRGLGEIWSNQPFFLPAYSTYILSLEAALQSLDNILPSTHSLSPLLSSSKSKSTLKSNPLSALVGEDKKLAETIMGLEERAAESGESSLAICLSKPLMRLGKLPLLMQNLLFHTDATAGEYEKTRMMALEIDTLIRSIEDEKVEEEELEKVRDLFARVEGISDKTLMAPRSSRVVIEEVSVWQPPKSNPPSASPPSRRSVSDTQPTATNYQNSKSKSATRRISDFLLPVNENRAPTVSGKNDLWDLIFSDVVVRVRRIGVTDVPGFSKNSKGKFGKQERNLKVGRVRNLYRFVRVERWETREVSPNDERNRISMDEQESLVSDDEDAESIMSFCYESDDPKPMESVRNFKSIVKSISSSNNQRRVSSSNQAVIGKDTTAKLKFGNRLISVGNDENGFITRATSPTPRLGFNSPTSSSLARKAATPTPTTSPSFRILRVPPPSIQPKNLIPKNSIPSNSIPSNSIPSNPHPLFSGGGIKREESTMSSGINLYEAFWESTSHNSLPTSNAVST